MPFLATHHSSISQLSTVPFGHFLSFFGPDSVRVLQWRWNEKYTRHLAKVFGEPPKWYLRPRQGQLQGQRWIKRYTKLYPNPIYGVGWIWLNDVECPISRTSRTSMGKAWKCVTFLFDPFWTCWLRYTDSATVPLCHGTHSVVSLIQHCPGILPAKAVQEQDLISG